MQSASSSRDGSAPARSFSEAVAERLEGQRLAPGTDIARTVGAVLGVLLQRISSGEARRAVGALPGVTLLETSSATGRAAGARFDFDELVQRVAAASETAEDTARGIALAAFAELRAALPPHAVRSIASQLPADILALWTRTDAERPRDPAARTPAPARPLPDALRVRHPFFDELEARARLPQGVTGAAAFVATMCLLSTHLTSDLATRTRRALPAPLHDLLFRCGQLRVDEVTRFTRAEFLDTLGAALDVSTDAARSIAACVLDAVTALLPETLRAELGAQLPADLRSL